MTDYDLDVHVSLIHPEEAPEAAILLAARNTLMPSCLRAITRRRPLVTCGRRGCQERGLVHAFAGA